MEKQRLRKLQLQQKTGCDSAKLKTANLAPIIPVSWNNKPKQKMMNESIVTPIEELIEKAGEYGKTSIELLKLKAIDKSVSVISSLAVKTVLLIVVAMLILSISIGVALWTGELLGRPYHGFFVMAGFYALATIVLFLFRDQWIRKPVNESMIKKILQ